MKIKDISIKTKGKSNTNTLKTEGKSKKKP